MTEQLKPCPFCGGKAILNPFECFINTLVYDVKCSECHCGTISYSSIEKAVTVWNRRAEA